MIQSNLVVHLLELVIQRHLLIKVLINVWTRPTLKNKVSPHIQTQLPEFVQSDHPLFSLFLKHYYEFLEAGELVVTGTNNYVVEETITKNYVLDETGETLFLKILLASLL